MGLKSYGKAILPTGAAARVGQGILALAAIVSAAAGGHYLMTLDDGYDFGRLLAYAIPLFVLLVSLMLNVRQYLVWLKERERVERAEKLYDMAKKLADSAKRMYDDEEQSWWTTDDLTWESEEISPRRMGESPGIRVSVQSKTSIRPIVLRFWFNQEVTNPSVSFQPVPKPEPLFPRPKFFVGETATVHQGGRVDVRWDNSSSITQELGDELIGDSKFFLAVFAESPDATLRALRVQRRYKVS